MKAARAVRDDVADERIAHEHETRAALVAVERAIDDDEERRRAELAHDRRDDRASFARRELRTLAAPFDTVSVCGTLVVSRYASGRRTVAVSRAKWLPLS